MNVRSESWFWVQPAQTTDSLNPISLGKQNNRSSDKTLDQDWVLAYFAKFMLVIQNNNASFARNDFKHRNRVCHHYTHSRGKPATLTEQRKNWWNEGAGFEFLFWDWDWGSCLGKTESILVLIDWARQACKSPNVAVLSAWDKGRMNFQNTFSTKKRF